MNTMTIPNEQESRLQVPERTAEAGVQPPTADEGVVLVVDDEPHNRELLSELLEARGFRPTTAEDGETALASVAQVRPDAILLDVMMPGMDGFQVCRRLKGDQDTAHIPVILVTALSERADRIQGMEAGADDFLHKPVDRTEVLLRVRNAVVGKRLFDELREKYDHLRRLERLRDDLTRMLVHDMRSPLTAISTNLQLLEMSLGPNMDEEVSEDLEHARLGVTSLMDMVNMILDVSRSEELDVPLQAEETDARETVEKGVDPLRALARSHEVEVRLPPEPLHIWCDPDLVRRTVTNLFGNAVKFTPDGGSVTVSAHAMDSGIQVTVADTGPGIPEEERATIFDKFTRGRSGQQAGGSRSTGLGLSFCKMAVEAHGGRIGVESEEGAGSTFWFRLPVNPEEA